MGPASAIGALSRAAAPREVHLADLSAAARVRTIRLTGPPPTTWTIEPSDRVPLAGRGSCVTVWCPHTRRRRDLAGKELDGVRVAILATDGFEQAELEEPKKALDKAGADVKVVSPSGKAIKGWDMTDWGRKVDSDLALADASADEFDALVLPGGVINPDKLRIMPEAVALVKAFFDAGKPVAAICHGPWTVLEAGCARGKRMTSWPSLKTDLRNAGADWVDQEVVVDGNLVTSRKPDDLPAFNREMIKLFARQPAGAA
jgi:protease I